MKKLLAMLIAGLAALAGASAVQAQAAYPAKPIRWIVPYPAGGGSDFLARTIGNQLAIDVAQPVLVDNKAGGNTAIAAAETARAAPDGYTVLSADNGTLVFNPVLYRNLSYNPTRDLAPVTLMGRFPMVLIVGPASNAKDAKDFIAQAKAQPGKISFASAGAGSPHHLAMELLKQQAGLHMVHIPYRGAAPALADVAGGQLAAMMTDVAAGNAFIKSGKVRALAVANAKRLPQLPDVPTFAELGIPNVEAAALVGLVAPAATPPEVIASLQKSVAAAIRNPAVNKKLMDFGVEPVGSSSAEFGALIASESTRWQKLIRDLKIFLD
jgi:tripartite-type tricarboxylate transporter receptor subunit TctC